MIFRANGLQRTFRRVRLLIPLFLLGLGYFLYWDLTTNFCIEESSCVPTLYFFRDYILRSLHLAYPLNDASALSEADVSPDKIVIIAHTDKEDVSWVRRRLPDWQHALYNVEKDAGELGHIPKNKGREAMVYLTYMIEQYDYMPDINFFLHAHEGGYREAWHVDAPLHDQVYQVRAVNTNFVRERGYMNLRCITELGCDFDSIWGPRLNIRVQDWNGVFKNTSTPPGELALSSQGFPVVNALDFVEELPRIEAPCCAQFVVTADRIRARPKEDYIAMRQWLLDTDLNDSISGGVFEFLWHIILGEPASSCLDKRVCYCALYGRC